MLLFKACKIKKSEKINPFEIFLKLREPPRSAHILTNKYGQTVLHLASYFNNLEIVKHVLEDLNKKDAKSIVNKLYNFL